MRSEMCIEVNLCFQMHLMILKSVSTTHCGLTAKSFGRKIDPGGVCTRLKAHHCIHCTTKELCNAVMCGKVRLYRWVVLKIGYKNAMTTELRDCSVFTGIRLAMNGNASKIKSVTRWIGLGRDSTRQPLCAIYSHDFSYDV